MYLSILLKMILGYVRIEVEGYYIERFINICRTRKILIWNLKREKGVKLYLNIGIQDFRKIKDIVRKTRCKIKIKRKRGLPFILFKYKKRKIFVLFLMIVMALIFVSSRYVWNIEIQVEDNLVLENIMQDLEEAGLKRGMLKSKIETGSVIEEIRLKRNDISWIGIDIKGTNVIVKTVKMQEKPEIVDASDYCNIVAKKSGIISKIIAQTGTAVVKVGDEVNEGDVLISGHMEGKYTGTRLVHSMGEVEAKIFYKDSTKIYYHQEDFKLTGNEEKKFQIKFNNFQINFYKTLSNFKIYDTIEATQNLKIFSNFYLPISVVKITNNEKEKIEKDYNNEEAINLGVQELSSKIEQKIEQKDKIIR